VLDPTGSISTFVATGAQLEPLALMTPVANQGCGSSG